MKKIFTNLVKACLAIVLLGGGVSAFGQTFWGGPGWCGSGPTGTNCKAEVIIDGFNYYYWFSSLSGMIHSTPSAPSGGTASCTSSPSCNPNLPNSPVEHYWISGGMVNHITYTIQTGSKNCNAGGCSQTYTWSSSVHTSVAASAPSGWIYDWNGTWGSWNMTPPNHNHDIKVYLKPTEISLTYKDPRWEHREYSGTFNISTGWSWSDVSTAINKPATARDMTTDDNGLRLTGNSPQIQDLNNTADKATSKLLFRANRLLFDKEWDVSFGGVTVDWNPITATSTGTIGFQTKQTVAITKNGGVLALGSDCNDSRSGITVKTDGANLTVDSYNYEAHEHDLDCDDALGTVDVAYNIPNTQTTINNNQLQITNSWGNCSAVNFCSLFQPTFSGAGELLINPNVTNFKAGATFDTDKNGNILITSNLITTTNGDFKYTRTGTGSLLIKIDALQTGTCSGCGVFKVVNNDFITDVSGAGAGSKIEITDPNSTITGSVEITKGATTKGNYTHKGHATAGNEHTVNVKGHILIDGATDLLLAAKDAVKFNSTKSWITYGGKFQYKGDGTLDIEALGECTGVCSSPGGYVWFKGAVETENTVAGTVIIKSHNDSVKMDNTFTHKGVTGNMTVSAETHVGIKGVISSEPGIGVLIARIETGNDSIYSNGNIVFEYGLKYTQALSALTGSGLRLLANGVCNKTDCGNHPVGGHIHIGNKVEIINALNGYADLQSAHSHILMYDKFVYTNPDGQSVRGLNVEADTYIKVHDTTRIQTGERVNSTFTAHKGYIEFGKGNVDKPFIYEQTKGRSLDSGLFITAGYDYSFDQTWCDFSSGLCDDGNKKASHIWFDGAVSILFADSGRTQIHAKADSIHMDSTFNYSAKGGILDMEATAGVIIKDTATINFTERPNTTTIRAHHGYVHVGGPFKYKENASTATTDDFLHIWAQGGCGPTWCNPLGGFVWFGDYVTTTNTGAAWTKIESDSSYIRMEKTFTHKAVDGHLDVLAGSKRTFDISACGVGCENLTNEYYRADSVLTVDNFAYPPHGRGYIWIHEAVTDSMKGTGNSTYRSYGDIVQFNDSVTFADVTGSNLLVDGLWGVRTLGRTTITNNAFNQAVLGTTSTSKHITDNDNPNDVDYAVTTGQGHATYLSSKGFVDFGVPKREIKDTIKFTYTAKDEASALLIQGHSRVYFGDSTTINMGTTAQNTVSGNAKIYSPDGWIQFADTLGYTGKNGDFIIYANGGSEYPINTPTPKNDIKKRSEMNPALTCDADRGGFILFDSITQISYKNAADTGKTWIRSNFDDVVIGDMFTYKSAEPAHAGKNGEFIMQAGQDIYGRNYDADKKFRDTIRFIQQGDSSILLEAKKSIHLQQMLLVERENAVKGDITLKAGYNSFAEPAEKMSSRQVSYRDKLPTAALAGLAPGWMLKGDCTPTHYGWRFDPDDKRNTTDVKGSMLGGDIWLESRVLFDLTKTKPTTGDSIATTLRAFNSIFIDSTFVYVQDTLTTPLDHSNDNVLLFAEIGNIEAAATRQNKADFHTNGYIADDTVHFIFNEKFRKEFRMQAGNQVWGENQDGGVNEDAKPTSLSCWDANNAQYFGNILFNKPFIMDNKGTGYSIISAARDIETQVMAPFTFNYDNLNSGKLYITAGRHVETHAMMRFNYPTDNNSSDITVEAGRLGDEMTVNPYLCKKEAEVGSNLTEATDDHKFPLEPDVETGGVNSKNNSFAEGGSGNGSILLFDSMEFNYKGAGKIFMVAENGNIESDPYLHRYQGKAANPGWKGLNGNYGDGYRNDPVYQHDAQLTFNHAGTGVTELKAINIKLHDRIEYAGTSNQNKNGQFYLTAYDSILTRNLKYTNPKDSGSVFITTAKYKNIAVPNTECDNDGNDVCATYPYIRQGHIVLGYGADTVNQNKSDSIIFDFNKNGENGNVTGGNVHILAGFEGFEKNKSNGKVADNSRLFEAYSNYNLDRNKGKGYGGNITFDYTEFYMPTGNGRTGGFTEIRTPNGNIWGKDSILYRGVNGDLLIDAGLGSVDDKRAILWHDLSDTYLTDIASCRTQSILNTSVPFDCNHINMWRTGNIMMKGAHLNFGNPISQGTPGTGDAIFRTREGYIDMYDAFTVDSMAGNLLVYAGMDNLTDGLANSFGDVSMRDFAFSPVVNNGSIFFGADDNIMLNYGNSNLSYDAYGKINPVEPRKGFPEWYDVTVVNKSGNPYYWTSYKNGIDAYVATYNVNKDGYLFYKQAGYDTDRRYHNNMHQMFRGTDGNGVSGNCVTKENGARDLLVDFKNATSGGFASVASNYIDLFTKFTYWGGTVGSGLGSVPGMSNLHGEDVRGFGLYLKSQYNGAKNYNWPEDRRTTCEGCGVPSKWPMEEKQGVKEHPEMTYIGFHDDARIHTQNQKTWIEAPVTEFFGHADLDANTDKGSKTNITVKTDSLIFHDSVIIEGPFVSGVNLIPFTTDTEQRSIDMRYGVINDVGGNLQYYENSNRDVLGYEKAGPAISMEDRNLPVLELGYQRCTPPGVAPISAPNRRSIAGRESTPTVGGDLILAFKWDFKLPMFNSVVANNARISFLTDSFDHVLGGEYINAFIRTDLLRIRNKVEFYTDPAQPKYRSGKFVLADHAYMDELMNDAGMYVNHLHTEPGSELSIPGEDSLIIWAKTTVGGYGNIHENVFVKNGGILAPGHASLMENDCATPLRQGKLTVHDLAMEQHSIIRISISNNNPCFDETGKQVSDKGCTGTDILSVHDTIHFNGKIPLLVLPEGENLQPGCYLFLEYGDSLGVSKEYVRNLVLLQQRHLDVYFGLDFSQPGKVLLCVSRLPPPEVQRYVDLPLMEGVSYNYIKVNGEKAIHVVGRNYVKSHQDFEMNLSFTGTPQKVWAQGFYSNTTLDLDATATRDADGSFTYIIRQVVEPWSISFGPQLSTVPTGNGILDAQNVWTYRNTLYINVPVEDVVSIYSITGVLNRKLEVPAGLTKQVLDRGVYIVTLKDGKVYKIIVK